MGANWREERTQFPGGEKITVRRDRCTACFSEIIAGWQNDAGCRAVFLDALSQTRFSAYFWEMPPIARGGADIPYECVIIESRALARLAPDPEAFSPNFEQTNEAVITFSNLGGDALLVVPRQIGEVAAYAHLGVFLRHGPEKQMHEFLQTLGRAAEQELRDRAQPIWISTSGLGVAWLHARLDSRPKYYQHRPYREW